MTGYDYGPSENELVLNVTSQLLHEMSTRYPASTALAPTRREENVLGYDVDVRELLGVVFQFKRPSAIRARTHPTQLPKPTSTATPVRFETNIEQWSTLVAGFGPTQSFHAIPPVLDGGDLYQALNRTVFVDVYGVLPQTSLLYIVPDGCAYSGGHILIEGKIRNKDGSTYRVPPVFVYCFDDIKAGLSSNWLGLQLYRALEPDRPLDTEQSIEEQRVPTEDLSKFESRLESLSRINPEREFRARDALQNAVWWLQELSNSNFRTERLGSVHAELASTRDLSPEERWKQIFLNANRDGPYDSNQVAAACEDFTEIAEDAFDELRDDLISDSDTPPATKLLQRANAEICMLGCE
jgi:hypothetical protein